jgi:hypothetical protein
MRRIALALAVLLVAGSAVADVSLVERNSVHQKAAKGKPGRPGHTNATGSIALIDSQGMKYFINTNITFSTSSSASGAASEASYTHAVAASTLNGGTTSSTLNDSYDGYNTLCLSLNHTVANCETGNANFVIFNKNGPPTTECLGSTSGVNRQVVFPVQTSGNIQMQRKVFVPDNDEFARWLNYFTNTGATPQTVTAVIANNLGSDTNTIIVNDSNNNTTPDTTVTWVTTFQNFTGTTTSDPRLGHVLQGANHVVGLSGIFFENGNDNPFWGYTFTLAPGETKILMNFGVNQPTKAAANAKAAQLAGLPPNALQCTTTAEQTEIANFSAAPPIATVPALSTTGLAALALLLAGAALLEVRRRSANRRPAQP